MKRTHRRVHTLVWLVLLPLLLLGLYFALAERPAPLPANPTLEIAP